VPRITQFYSCVHTFGCKLSLVILFDSDFGITPVDDITIGIICAAFCFHIADISFIHAFIITTTTDVTKTVCFYKTGVETHFLANVFFQFYGTTPLTQTIYGEGTIVTCHGVHTKCIICTSKPSVMLQHSICFFFGDHLAGPNMQEIDLWKTRD